MRHERRPRGDEGHVEPAQPERGGRLGADEAPADHDRRVRLLCFVPHGVGIDERSVRVDTDEIAAGKGQLARAGPGRDDERPVPEPLASHELDLVLGGVDRVDSRVQAQLDDCLLPLLERLHERALALDLAAQVALCQGRAVVGRIRLGADDGDVLLPACAAVLGGDAGRGEATADDDDRVIGHLRVLPAGRCSTHAIRSLQPARR